jgi:hypothetical protein
LFLQLIVSFSLFDGNPLEEISFAEKMFSNNLARMLPREPNYVTNAMGRRKAG